MRPTCTLGNLLSRRRSGQLGKCRLPSLSPVSLDTKVDDDGERYDLVMGGREGMGHQLVLDVIHKAMQKGITKCLLVLPTQSGLSLEVDGKI